MSEHLREYTVAIFELERAIRSVPDDSWDDASPCEGWSLRQVAGHAMGVMSNVGGRLGVRPMLDPFGDVASIAGEDPRAAFRVIRTDVLEALDRPGSLATPVSSRLGEMRIDDYLVPMTNDAFVHAWDVAHGAGTDDRLDPWLLEIVAERMMAADLPRHEPRRYAEAVIVADHASLQDRLLAYTGRVA